MAVLSHSNYRGEKVSLHFQPLLQMKVAVPEDGHTPNIHRKKINQMITSIGSMNGSANLKMYPRNVGA